MKKVTNCPNCGAPIDKSRDSCEYCGTPYPEKPETAKLYADNQLVMEVQIESNKRADELIKQLIDRDRLLLKAYNSITAWQPTPEEERKMIENMRNVAPRIFPKVEPTVEYIKYNTKLERLMDTVWFWFAVSIATILCSLLPFIIF